MKIKEYVCKCGHNDFFFADKGSQKGIYCSCCGKWLKWADKDEQNLDMKQEPRKGHWIIQPKRIYSSLVCDKCLSQAPYHCETNFCPNCGADMRSEKGAKRNERR